MPSNFKGDNALQSLSTSGKIFTLNKQISSSFFFFSLYFWHIDLDIFFFSPPCITLRLRKKKDPRIKSKPSLFISLIKIVSFTKL